ncbi:MAG: hypothetical protein Tsb009_12910 [Planctomycetaceae bacterium]
MPAISRMLNEALEKHRAGDFSAAEAGYREILRIDARHPDALHLLGVAATQQSRHADAIEWFQAALNVTEPTALLLNNLGTAYRNVNRLDDALECFQKAVQFAPEFAGGHFNLAMAFQQTGKFDEAKWEFQLAVENDPTMTEAYLHLGRLFQSNGNLQAASQCLEKAVDLQPLNPDCLFSLAEVRIVEQRVEDAENLLRKTLRLAPEHQPARLAFNSLLGISTDELNSLMKVEENVSHCMTIDKLSQQATLFERIACYDRAAKCYERIVQKDASEGRSQFWLGRDAIERGSLQEAVTFLLKAAEVLPDELEIRLHLGNVLADLGRYEDAIEHASHATRIAPDSAVAWYALGNLLREVERYLETVECYQKALTCNSKFHEARHNLGIVLRSLGRNEEAVQCFDELIARNSTDATAHLQRALTWLAMGKLTSGWDEYEWRWQAEAMPRVFSCSEWRGEPLQEKTLLVYAEQGIGDEIQFASCLPEVISLAKTCIVECDRRLVPLFARSFPDAKIVARPVSQEKVTREIDYVIATGSLPRQLRRSFTQFPQREKFLQADRQRISKWRSRFQSLPGSFHVGISWKGGTKPEAKRSRSTELRNWQPVLRLPNVNFVNLQYGNVQTELENCSHELDVVIHDWPDEDVFNDLDGLAARIAALDLVISTDNLTVHLAGALGVPTWVLLPFAADFRWMQGTARSPWYSSVQLLRQQKPGDWKPVFEAVSTVLKARSQRIHREKKS